MYTNHLNHLKSSDYLCLSWSNMLYNEVKFLKLVLQPKKADPLILVQIKIIY